MANFKNTIYDVITDKRTIPYNSNGTGTIIMEELKVIGLDGELEWDFEVPVSCGCEVNEY